MGGPLKKKFDPLWEIVDEQVSLQGHGSIKSVRCPRCHVSVELPDEVKAGARFRCGLCGAPSEVTSAESVADNGATEIAARLAE